MAVAFSGEVERVLHQAFQKARDAHHLSMTVEHLVLEMLREDAVVGYLGKCGTNIEALRALLEAKVASSRTAQIETVETQPNAEFSAVVRRMIDDAGRERRAEIVLHDVFLAVLEERKGYAASVLIAQTADPAAFERLREARARAARRPA